MRNNNSQFCFNEVSFYIMFYCNFWAAAAEFRLELEQSVAIKREPLTCHSPR